MNTIGSGTDEIYATQVATQRRYRTLELLIHWLFEPRPAELDELLADREFRGLFSYVDKPDDLEELKRHLHFLSARARHAWEPFLGHLFDHGSDDEDQLRLLLSRSPFAGNIVAVWAKPVGGERRLMRVIADLPEHDLLGSHDKDASAERSYVIGMTLIPTRHLELQRTTLVTRTY